MKLRFESIDKRFEDTNQRFEIFTNFIMVLTAGIFGLIGFIMWDRRIVQKKQKEYIKEVEVFESFYKKVNRKYVEKLTKAIKKILNKDEYSRKIFKEYGL